MDDKDFELRSEIRIAKVKLEYNYKLLTQAEDNENESLVEKYKKNITYYKKLIIDLEKKL